MAGCRKSRVAALMLLIVATWGARGIAQTRRSPSAHPTPQSSDESIQSAPSAGQVQFAHEYIAAVNAHDTKALRRMVAPRTLACYNARTEPYLTQWLDRQTRDQIPQPYSITVEPYKDSEFHPSALFTLPVAPTHQMNITIQSNGNEVVLGRPIAYQNGRWYVTPPCPTDLGIDKLISSENRRAKQAAQLEALYTGLKDPMLSDLKNLIRQNRIGEACTKYALAEKIDYLTGCKVVKRLAASMGIVVK